MWSKVNKWLTDFDEKDTTLDIQKEVTIEI
jgi:hypothetical protein